MFILGASGTTVIGALLVSLACLGFLASLALPKARPGNRCVPIRANIFKETAQVLRLVSKRRDIFLAVLGISWFWLIGIVYLAQLPAFAKDVLHADEHAVTLMLTLFSVGIGIGSVACVRLLKGEISARYVPLAALAMALFAFDLYFATPGPSAPPASAPLIPLVELMRRPSIWRVFVDLFLFAVAGGIYIVPLYTILQARSDESERARVIAAGNIVNAAFMVAGSLAATGMLAIGVTISGVFLAVAMATLVVAVYICGLLPDALLKSLFAWTLKFLYRIKIHGMENIVAAGEKAVIVVNHVSFLDAAFMAAFLPGRPTFAVNSFIAKAWWVRPFLSVVDAYPMDPTNPMSMRGLIHAVQAGRTCVIFPEGRITTTGALMKIYPGPGLIADKADAPIIPVRIDGAQYSPFSRLKGKVRRKWFPKVTITIQPATRLSLPEEAKGRERRQIAEMQLYDIMSRMMYETSDTRETLFAALCETARVRGRKAPAVEDVSRKTLSYGGFIRASLVLSRSFARETTPGEAMGLMLPNSTAAAASFFAMQASGRVPAMLNYTAGAGNVASACESARIRVVITSKRFIAQAGLDALAGALADKVKLVYLEDVRAQMGVVDKLFGLFTAPFAKRFAKRLAGRAGRTPDSPAVILFTSGSEGAPKGVALSHANALANCRQLTARVPISATDILFNALPIFHSFGLTGGLLLPLFAGIKTFLYPSPLHYRIVPEMVYDTNATIMFGADTFLAGYARAASAYDFYSIRYVFAGAERVREQTRRAWMDRFGLRIMEGYGATETAPVIAVNTPMHYKAGTVGRALPGIDWRLEPVPGILEGGKLMVKGPNVMQGYLRPEHPGVVEPPSDGWYDTGDIVSVDGEGYLRILGRAKRFAKIAGEMISLGQVETEITTLWPKQQHAVVAAADGGRGERLVLATTNAEATRAAILAHFRTRGLSELMVPKTILKMEKLPLLGTGKTDYPQVQKMAQRTANKAEEQ